MSPTSPNPSPNPTPSPSPSPNPSGTKSPNPLTRILKFFGVTILTLAIIAFLLILAAPTVVSTEWGRDKTLSIVNSQIPGSLSIKEISLSWLGSQKVVGFELKDPAGGTVVSFDSFSTESSLWQLIGKGHKLGKAQLVALNATIAQSEPGVTNLQKAVSKKHGGSVKGDSSASNNIQLPFTGDIEVTNSKIALNTANAAPIVLKDVNAQITMTSLAEPVTAHIVGATQQGSLTGKFVVDISLAGFDSAGNLELTTDEHGMLTTGENGQIHFNVQVENLPVDLLDQVAAMGNAKLSGMVRAALGESLNLTVDHSISNNNLVFEFHAKTQNLLATMDGEVVKGKFTLKEPGKVVFTLTPDFVNRVTAFNGNAGAIKLVKAAKAELTIDQLMLPLLITNDSPHLLDLKNLAMSAHLELLQADFAGSPMIGDIALRGIKATFETPETNSTATINVQGQAQQNGQPVQIKLNATIDKPAQMDELLDSMKEHSRVDLELKDFPFALADGWLGKDHALVETLGNVGTFIVTAEMNDRKADFTVKVESDKLAIPALHLRMDDYLTLTQAATVRYQVASASANRDIPMEFTIEKFQFPMPKDRGEGVQLKGDLALKVKGEGVDIDGLLSIGDTIELASSQPLQLSFALTPERFNAIRSFLKRNSTRKDKITLMEPATVNARVSALSFPLGGGNIAVNTDVTVDKLHIADKATGQEVTVQNVSARLDSKNITKNLNFAVSATQKTDSTGASEIAFNGSVNNLYNEAGQLNMDAISARIQGKALQLPVTMFCTIACFEPSMQDKVAALAGRTLDVEVKVELKHMEGPVYAELKGENGFVKLDGKLTDDIFTLNKPFVAKVKVTPELGKAVLQDIVPFLNEVLGADKPLEITIDPSGFSVPVKTFNVNRLQIGSASLDMGKMSFSGNGELGKILSLFSKSASNTLSVWFTPLYVSMDSGVVNVQRTDLLITGHYPIAVWGKVDLPGDKVNMIIGLTAQALKYSFKIGNLDKDYVMQIPFRGTIANAAIDKTKAAAKISALIAQSQGGSKGMVLGAVLQIAGGGLSDEKTPAPTTNPLPWKLENDVSPTSAASDSPAASTAQQGQVQEASPSPKKSGKHKVKDELEKGANKLLNELFK